MKLHHQFHLAFSILISIQSPSLPLNLTSRCPKINLMFATRWGFLGFLFACFFRGRERREEEKVSKWLGNAETPTQRIVKHVLKASALLSWPMHTEACSNQTSAAAGITQFLVQQVAEDIG